jgi:hypothetical protein
MKWYLTIKVSTNTNEMKTKIMSMNYKKDTNGFKENVNAMKTLQIACID